MALHEQYILRVKAGATYDASSHQDVLVNSEKSHKISSELIDCQLHMRIKDYRGRAGSFDANSSMLRPALTLCRIAAGLASHLSLLLFKATSV